MCNYETEIKDWVTVYDNEDVARQIIKGLCAKRNYKELHIAQWSWLSLDSERSEAEWFDTFGIPEVKNYCFACGVAQEAYYRLPKREAEEIADFDEYRPAFCPCCPLTDQAEEECMAGLYGDWLETFGEEREEVAWQIASVEWTTK